MPKGILYLIPTTLGADTLHTIPRYVRDIIHSLDEFIVERTKTARRFIRATNGPTPIADLTFHELNKHTSPTALVHFLKNIEQGKNIGLMSEAGCPGVADPGAAIVALAHQKNITVQPLVGPSSILLALMASGMNGQNFAFTGYLPIKRPERLRTLKQLELTAYKNNQTQIFMETPYRNHKFLEDMLRHLKPNTQLCIATDITLPTANIQTKPIKDWKNQQLPNLHKRPTIFLIYK